MEFSGASGRSQAKMWEPTLVSLAVPKPFFVKFLLCLNLNEPIRKTFRQI